MSRSACNGTLALFLLLASCSHRVSPPPRESAETPDRDARILDEINRLRSDPSAYAAFIEQRLPFYRENVLRVPDQVPIRTFEGAAAAREAVHVLRQTAPVPTLAPSDALDASAKDHALDIGPRGLLGHEGTRGETLAQRIGRYAHTWDYIGENISFGPDTPRAVVIELLIDDNVPGRGHRKLLLDPRFRRAGASCAPHAVYRTLCVIDFAGELAEKGVSAREGVPRPAAARRR